MDPDNFEVAFINEEQTCATFKFYHEDHTLANVLRYVCVYVCVCDTHAFLMGSARFTISFRSQILENASVDFCGYSIPHPSEDYFQLQIQTKNGLNVYDALISGFEELSKLCDKSKKSFIEAVDRYNHDSNMS